MKRPITRREFGINFVKSGALMIPAYMAGLSGIIRAGSAPSLNVAGTARVGTLSRPATPGGGPAVAFDSAFEKGFNSTTSPASFFSNAGDVTGTVNNNSNRVLIVGATFYNTLATVGTVTTTWNGDNCTLITSQEATGGLPSVFIFGRIAPATGNNELVCTFGGGSSAMALGAVSLYNCNQSTGWQNGGNDIGGASPAESTITSANGNMAVIVHGNNNGTGTAIGQGTSAWIETDFDGNYGMAYRASTGASTVVSFTYGGSFAFVNVKVDVIKA